FHKTLESRQIMAEPQRRLNGLSGERAMSALGQKRTFAAQTGMSGLPPKGDICGAVGDVRFGPIAHMSTAAAKAVSSYPFFAAREGRSPSVPIWSEVDTRTHNKDIAKHRALIDSASSAQTHRKPSVHSRPTDLRS